MTKFAVWEDTIRQGNMVPTTLRPTKKNTKMAKPLFGPFSTFAAQGFLFLFWGVCGKDKEKDKEKGIDND